ncbi:MAG: DNA replication/repair protein RecF [Candidatus Izemoplasmatales bacterium]|jgi:DNA replication and repair protein RecF
MKIDKITLTKFRNYRKQSLELGLGINFIIGPNGAGKTNFLESVYVLALAKSYKVADSDLIHYGSEYAKIHAAISLGGSANQLSLVITELGKKALLNGVEIKRLSDYIGKLNVVSFLPEDLNLIKGAPRDRRYYFDVFLGQIDRDYLDELSQYKHLLKQRNELLKHISEAKHPDIDLLDVITEQFVESSQRISHRRKTFIERMNGLLETTYRYLSQKDEHALLAFAPSIETQDALSIVKSKYRQDLLQKTTTIGAHRDDYLFQLEHYPARVHASQGEQRTFILALILALGETIYNTKKEWPVFLLDDVFSELDQSRQNRLMEYLMQKKAQTIVTATGTQEIRKYVIQQAKLFSVNEGTIKEERLHD